MVIYIITTIFNLILIYFLNKKQNIVFDGEWFIAIFFPIFNTLTAFALIYVLINFYISKN